MYAKTNERVVLSSKYIEKGVKMLNRISMADSLTRNYSLQSSTNVQKRENNATNVIQFKGQNASYGADKLAAAYRAYNKIPMASTVSFTGSLATAFEELNQSMVTCQDIEHGRKGEEVGSRADVSQLVSKFIDDLPRYDDAMKTTIQIAKDKDKGTITDARTQVKKGHGDNMKFEMVVRTPRKENENPGWTEKIQQILKFELEPYSINLDSDNRRSIKGTPENAYVLNTKGKLMAVVEDGDNVLLTNAGKLNKKDSSSGYLNVTAEQNKNVFKPFEVHNVPVVEQKSGGSQGGGTELVIGLEDGRFVPEIIDSIATFVEKVDNGEIVLDEFKPAEGAQNMQLSMLAGGFGSRAEYTNASSSKIMHGNPQGSNLTKGCFRTATGLTPMETTFVSLHKAGLLDCSKGNLGIGKNIKFYLNDSGVNGGNGGFTVDMYDTMEREGRDSLLILPNDAMSRIPKALSEMTNIMNSGNAAVVMVAKEVDKEDARGSLGIMKINDRGEIEAFAEKPKEFEEGYVDENDNCFANTFQFAVSKEAFKALSILEPYLPANNSGKEPRDWSKTFTPILMALTQNEDAEGAQKQIKDSIKQDMPLEALSEAKEVLGNQKIYAVKSNEPWADCGTLNALYHTTMQIASGDFPLEDFERKHVLDSVNTQTGLVASSPEQKAEIEDKYDIEGQVMAVPKAKAVSNDIIDEYADAITRYSDKAE